MFLLGPLFLISITIFIVGLTIFNINRYFLSRYNRISNEIKDSEEHLSNLETRLRDLKTQDLRLQQNSELVFSLYEMSRDLAKYLDEDRLLNVFCEKAHLYLDFEDCRLIDEFQINQEDLEDYQIFDLSIENEILGYLAIKGLGESDKENFAILSSQFTLALQKARLYKEIQRLAITDSLTGIYTRRYFLERVDEELHRSLKFDLSFSFLILDIDHFKDCNDKYGHLVGDVVLKELAGLLKRTIRQIDLLGRFGGEEFCLLLPETKKSSAYQAAWRIYKSVIETKIKAYDESIGLTVSIGIANFPEDADNLRELIDRSDWALYRAKQTGRNRICMYGVYK